MYEVTWVETGRTKQMSYDECVANFGEDEFLEILDGHLPHIVAINLDDDGEPPYDMTDVEADADTLASAGWGTDEDYGYFGDYSEGYEND